MKLVITLVTVSCLLPVHFCAQAALAADRPPNIVYIMSDELAYYELEHMGNPHIKTPRIDRMAREGIRFTQALAGAPVCAPLRCNLMTGKHAGHASVRANDGGTPLREGEVTMASMLKPLGYATGGFGKWGCGGRGSTGVPENHGFDTFFGYYDQVHAHSFYPPYLVHNSKEVVLPGNKGGRSGQTYSHYEIMKRGLDFIRDNKDRPFFCYLPITPPHGMFDIPSTDPAYQHYKDKDWPQDVKNYAAMVTMVDNNVGQVLDLLKELGLEDNTIVFFTGDNGGQDRFRSKEHPRGFFGPNVNPKTGVEFRGGKGNLYEGGLRIPYIVRWPGRIKPGQVSDHLFYQPDVMPTLAQLTGAKAPKDIDGISFLPTLLGAQAVGHSQRQHKYLYWEFGGQTAVRIGSWKAIKPRGNSDWALYDLTKDISEQHDVADKHADIVAKAKQYAAESHEPARPGSYTDRTLHEKDRRAKWGDRQPPTRNRRGNKSPAAGPVNKLPTKGLLPVKSLALAKVSSENTGNDRHAKYALDGDPRTVWHTQFMPTLREHPHEIMIDLGKSRTVRGFHYLARQDGGWNGAFAKTEFYVADSLEAFTKPVAKTTFGRTKKPQAVKCDPVKGRYVLVRVLSEVNGGPWASAAEIGVEGE